MDVYHITILAVAAVILLLILTAIGAMMQSDTSTAPWPPVAGRCPDGWTEDEKVLNKCTPFESNKGLLANLNPINFNAKTVCEKKNWAKKWNVNWDGVSNYNKCP